MGFELLLIGLGIVVGFFSGFFGIGGGAIVVTALLYMGYDVKQAIGISIVQMVMSSLFGSYLNYKRGLFKINQSIYVGLGGLVGAAFSGPVVAAVPSLWLKLLLLVILSLGVIKSFMKKSLSEREISLSPAMLGLAGAGIGLVAISAGIGGGVLISVLFFGFFGYDIKKAVSMGLFFVIFASISGLVSFSLSMSVDYWLGFLLGLGSLLGVFFGTKAQASIDRALQKRLNLAFNLVVIATLINKIINA